MSVEKYSHNNQSGISLVESMVALTILSFALAAGMNLVSQFEKGSDLLEKNLAAKSLIEQTFSKLQGKPGAFPLMRFPANNNHGAWVSCFDKNGVEVPNKHSKSFVIRDLGHTPAKLQAPPDKKKINISGYCQVGEFIPGIRSNPYYELHIIPRGRGNTLKGTMSVRIQVILLHGKPKKARSHISFDAFYDTAL